MRTKKHFPKQLPSGKTYESISKEDMRQLHGLYKVADVPEIQTMVIDRVLEAFRLMVYKEARKISNRNPLVDIEDLVQTGRVALIDSFSSFDPVKYSNGFYAYAQHSVKQRLRERDTESLLAGGKVHSKFKTVLYSANKIAKALRIEDSHDPRNAAVVAKALHTDEKSMHTMLMAARGIASLNACAARGGTQEEVEIGDLLPDESIGTEDALEDFDLMEKRRRHFDQALTVLNPDELKVLTGRTIYDADSPKPTLDATISLLGKPVSRERIRQIEKSAVIKLQAYLIEHCSDLMTRILEPKEILDLLKV